LIKKFLPQPIKNFFKKHFWRIVFYNKIFGNSGLRNEKFLANCLKLNDEQFNQKVSYLGNSSIGGHTRHVIELLQCAIDGYANGEIDYLNRRRDLKLETERLFAHSVLIELTNSINAPDKPLSLVVEQIDGAIAQRVVTTTYYREVVYNTEHTIHHLALIKVAIIDMKLDVIGSDFGMAYSTIKYQASLQKS